MNILDEHKFVAGGFVETLQVVEHEGIYAVCQDGNVLEIFDEYKDAKELFIEFGNEY